MPGVLETLKACRAQFADYARQHRAKGTPEADTKAVVNDGMVTLCDQALTVLATERNIALHLVEELQARDVTPGVREARDWATLVRQQVRAVCIDYDRFIAAHPGFSDRSDYRDELAKRVLAALTAPVGEGDQGNQGFIVSRTSPSSPVEATREGWRPIESAPEDQVILLFGLLEPHPENRGLYGNLDRPIRCTGYWDTFDEAWSLTGSTWLGPWIKPTHWQPLATPPTEGEGS